MTDGKLTSQSIYLLSPQPKVVFYDSPTKKSGTQSPDRGGSSRAKLRKLPEKVKVKPAISEAMKYQGLEEAQMIKAVKTPKE